MSGTPAARLGDAIACPKCGTTALVQGSPNVFFDGLPAATLGHACGCGATVSAAVIPNVFINGQPAAVLGSVTSHGGVVIGGSGTVVIGTQGDGASTGSVASGACASSGESARLVPGQAAPLGLRGRERPGPGAFSDHPLSAPLDQEKPARESERPVEQRITLRIGVFFDGTGNNLFNAATGATCRAEAQGFRQDQAESIALHCEKFMLKDDSSYANAETNIARLYRLYRDDTQRAIEQDENA
ncbi:PAAR domain-containing protein, partial [Pseudomonas sp. EpS/L25]|uniref:PAAR domain-containing protein n=1 Tax=Pseudomonas sp. EpS/L25 TaxID=1749078 RepID=UPI0015A73ECB